MKLSGVLLIAYIVFMAFWLVNHYYRKNVKYEQEYREGRRPRW
jgi:hypothetical protein